MKGFSLVLNKTGLTSTSIDFKHDRSVKRQRQSPTPQQHPLAAKLRKNMPADCAQVHDGGNNHSGDLEDLKIDNFQNDTMTKPTTTTTNTATATITYERWKTKRKTDICHEAAASSSGKSSKVIRNTACLINPAKPTSQQKCQGQQKYDNTLLWQQQRCRQETLDQTPPQVGNFNLQPSLAKSSLLAVNVVNGSNTNLKEDSVKESPLPRTTTTAAAATTTINTTSTTTTTAKANRKTSNQVSSKSVPAATTINTSKSNFSHQQCQRQHLDNLQLQHHQEQQQQKQYKHLQLPKQRSSSCSKFSRLSSLLLLLRRFLKTITAVMVAGTLPATTTTTTSPTTVNRTMPSNNTASHHHKRKTPIALNSSSTKKSWHLSGTPSPTVLSSPSCLTLFCFATMLLIFLCPSSQALRLAGGTSKSSSANKEQLYIGLIAPHTNFGKREYLRAIHTAVSGLNKTRGAKLTFFKDYQFEPRNIRFDMMSLTPSPTAILSTLCKEFLQFNVSAILYMMNNEQFGHSTASAQYFLQLAGYLGIPVISWNADNSGLERRASQSTLQLQLAPSIEHQSAAMLSILERYKWHQFSVVTSQIAGHDDFVQAVRERVAEMQDHFKFTILNAIVVTRTSDLMELVNSEARVMLLYATQSEAITILRAAEELKLTGENYVWVVSQSVIEKKDAHAQFPVGMLGVHFDTSSAALMNEISNAIKIYGYGVEAYVSDPANQGKKLNTQALSCEDDGRGRWDNGELFFKYLRNVSIEGDLNKPNIEFTADGDLKSAELKIMNLRPSANNKNLVWEEIGVWKSWEAQKLDIRDIAWPGNSHAPPQGVPEKFHLKITFLEEAPYINLSPADPVSGKCLMDRGVLCRVAADHEMADIDVGQAHRNESFYQCCSGFCIDLLEKFAEELGFTYELVRVEDGKWGTLENGKWNGVIADLVNRKTDMVLTSLMINTEREAVVDFSEPFMETGIAIVVAKRTGIISPTAFLEPFDTASWMLVGIVAIQAATFMIFLFEWLSPSGYDMKLYLQNTNVTPYRFSLFRTYWLVWAVLFQAAVHVDSPRGFTSRFMTNVWALFAVVFLAIYTANLAAFMITREEFHEFTGLNDSRLVHPYSHKPSFKYGTIPYSHTDSTINKYYKEMHYYMRQYNKSSVADGVAAVLNGNLDAFIYDGTVLDYLVAQDEDCRLMTVGSWYAMTGYGLAFSRNSKYVQMFNKRLLEFRANGDLERLRRYWMTGTCRPGKQEHKSSDPLALEQFLSAFLLLMAGILLAALLLLLEHVYFKYIRKRIAKKDGGHCCALISLSMGKSLTFRGAVYEATEILKKHRCNDPICDTHLWKVKHELDMTRLRVRQLEKVMDKHGIKPPQLRLASSSDLLNHHHLKERPPLMGNLSLAASAQDLYRWSYKTEIAEMETVL
ncbi:glutamate receptor ionotropic, NMDA 2C [Musca domestica]|uniref:Glutamate receptor ionotropic, NMDA 2C n=3 Tax=Musca TaxID=7369 RepID=A0A1I8M7N9_MUSDO|nr:glutamate receptor ionotropic, NMDA 2C [Musca domestica]